MYRVFAIILLSLFMSIPGQVAGEVYKWVDENGRVQFSDRPVDKRAKKVDIKKTAPPTAVSNERREKQRKLTSAFEQERMIKEGQKQRLKKQKQERVKNCDELKVRLAGYKTSSYLFEKDKDGNKSILTDKEREQAIARTEKEIKKICGK